jgi:hypothetical protein
MEINQNMMESTESPVTPPLSNNASIQPEAVATKTADANKEMSSSASPTNDTANMPKVQRPPIERVDNKKTCWAWDYIYMLSNGAIVYSRPSATQAVGIPCRFVCRLCFEDKANIPTVDCAVALHKNGISNGISHMQSKHRVLFQENAKKKSVLVSPIDMNSNTMAMNKPSMSSAAVLSTFLGSANNQKLKHVYSLAARLVVNNKLPLSTTTSDEFNELIHAASQLKIGTYVPMTKRKMDYLLVQMFSSFISDVRNLVTTTRALFLYGNNHQETTDDDDHNDRGWVIVCHDGWDSTLKQFFGVSVFLSTLLHGFGINWHWDWQLLTDTVPRSVPKRHSMC